MMHSSKWTLALIVCLTMVVVPCFGAAQNPIRLGFIYCFSGNVGYYGTAAKRGAELAIEEINKSGGLLNRKLVGLYADTKLDPKTGVQEARRLINIEHVDALLGIVSSGVAKAVSPVSNDLGTPLIITLAMTPDVTGNSCNPYTFRISQNGPQNLRGAALLASQLKPKKWTTIGPDYIFGYQCWEYFQKYLSEKRPDVSFAQKSETVFAPVKTKDWKPIVERAMKLDADGVLISLYGGNLRDFIKQASELGFFDGKREILMNLALSSEVLYSLKGLMPKGLWLSGLYWHKLNDSTENRKFVEAYIKRHKVFPDQNAHGAYAGVKAYAAAVKKAASTNKDQVVKALEGLTVEIPAGTITIRPEDHQAICDGVWGKTNGYDVKFGCRLLNPIKVFPGVEIIRSVSETACKRSRQVAESQSTKTTRSKQ